MTGLSQTSATLDATPFTLTVTGTNFVDGAVVQVRNSAVTRTCGSSTSLTAAVTAAQLNTTGTFAITVVNPGVGASNGIDFTVVNPVAATTGLSQTGAILGATPFTLTVTGTNFVSGAVV